MFTHRLADRCTTDREWMKEFFRHVDENPNSCQEVWLCSLYAFPPISKHRDTAKRMRVQMEEFKKRGIRVALQISNTIGGHSGSKFSDNTGMIRDDWHAPFFVESDGTERSSSFCTRSREFKEYTAAELEAYLEELDVCGVWIDDDFRMGNHRQSCWCDSCIAEFSARVGRSFTREELVEAVENDLDVRDAWIAFTSDRAYDAARFMAETVHRIRPDAYMGLQHGANGYMQGCGHTSVFQGFYDGSGIAPRSRPGGGSYEDFDPNTFVRKYRWLSHQTRYLPDFVKDVRPEVEDLPDVCYGKTMGGLRFETAFYFASGSTSMSYATMMRKNEPLSWLCRQLCDMSENFDWYTRLSEVNRVTRQDGVEIFLPEKPWHYMTEKPFEWENIPFDTGFEQMRCGYPMTLHEIGSTKLLHHSRIKAMTDGEIRRLLADNVVCDGESVALLAEMGYSDILGISGENIVTGATGEVFDDGFEWAFNFFAPRGTRLTLLSDTARATSRFRHAHMGDLGIASATTVTTLGGRWAVVGYQLFTHIVSFRKRCAIVDAIEWAGGKKLSAKLTTPDRVMVFPRAKADGTLAAVSVVSTSVGEYAETELELAGEYESAEWYSFGVKALPLAVEKRGGSTYIKLPTLNGWAVGTVFLN